MLDKTLYKAKIRDGKVSMESKTIQKIGRLLYYFDKQGLCGCLKKDVGVVIFLTPKEAIDYLLKELEHFVECGETYLAKTKEHLQNAQEYKIPDR